MANAPYLCQVEKANEKDSAFPGPEARTLREKTMRHPSLPGPGGQAILSPRTGLFRCRGARHEFRVTDEPASLCGDRAGPAAALLFPPMLFPRNVLASGPKVCFSREKESQK